MDGYWIKERISRFSISRLIGTERNSHRARCFTHKRWWISSRPLLYSFLSQEWRDGLKVNYIDPRCKSSVLGSRALHHPNLLWGSYSPASYVPLKKETWTTCKKTLNSSEFWPQELKPQIKKTSTGPGSWKWLAKIRIGCNKVLRLPYSFTLSCITFNQKLPPFWWMALPERRKEATGLVKGECSWFHAALC